MLGNRNAHQIARAILGKQHYIALWNMAKLYPCFWENLKRYLFGVGTYPYKIDIRRPLGIQQATLYSHHDMLTVNEIFCRQDYYAVQPRVVVDIGSNIGISVLYFLTRNRECIVYCYEPDPRNIKRLRTNLTGFEGRYHLQEYAVADQEGMVEFGIESTGRYGGIGKNTGNSIRVPCREINGVLEEVLNKHGRIDILKLDIEGMELPTVSAIDKRLLVSINRVYLEAAPEDALYPDLFRQEQFGSVCRLLRKQ